ncbi:MAG: hypothetical protein AB9907_10570 [Flexilinea sp.]
MEKILEMDEDFYKQYVQPKFFYLKPDELWKWQVDVLCFMGNNGREYFKPYIVAARHNKNTKVREMAQSLCNEFQI